MAIDLNLISIIVFYVAIAIFFLLNRKKIMVQYFVAFLYRTKNGLNFIRALARKFPRFWKYWGYVGIPVGFAGMIFITVFLFISAIKIFVMPDAIPSVSLVIPGVRIPGSAIFVPFWYGIISLIIVLIVHEGAHGVLSERWKIRLKSAGVGLFAIIPLAFVEPDEKKLEKAPVKAQLSVFAAGPFANICVAGIALLLLSLFAAPAVANTIDVASLTVSSVDVGYPAEQVGIVKGDRIAAIDDVPLSEEAISHLQSLPVGSAVSVRLQDRSVIANTVVDPNNNSRSYIGVKFDPEVNLVVKSEVAEKYGKLPLAWLYLSKLLFWLFSLNLGIGLINLLPLGPIDGGRMLGALLDKGIKNKKLAKNIWSVITMLSLFLLLFNIIGPYLVAGFAT